MRLRTFTRFTLGVMISGILALPLEARAEGPVVIRGGRAVKESPTAASAFRQGLAELERGNYEAAVKALRKAAAENPQAAETHYRLGLAYQGLGDEASALVHLRKAVALDGSFAPAREALGRLCAAQGARLLREGQTEQALDLLKEAVRYSPKHDEAYNNLGVALSRQGRIGEALDAFQQAVALNPGNIPAHYNLGLVYYALGNKDAAVTQYTLLTLQDPAAAAELFRLIQGTTRALPAFRY